MTGLRLLAFVLPLGLDSFAVAAALGALQPSARDRLRISAIFVVFEAGMPLIGVAAGASLARVIGGFAQYVAGAALVCVGGWMALDRDRGEAQRTQRWVGAHGVAAIVLGISISMDELAVGFTLGLVHLPTAAVIVAIGLQALIAAQLGLYLGARIGARAREGAERLAGVALMALGLFLLAEQLLR